MPDTNHLEIVISVLKYAGIVVGGVSGVLGTLTRTHEERNIPSLIIGGEPKMERKLTRWGRISLSLTILGAVVAGGSLFAETVISYQAGLAAQKRTEEQVRLARDSLAAISRDLTRFDSVSVRAVFELPKTGTFRNLRADLKRLTASSPNGLPRGVVHGHQKYSRQPELLIDLQTIAPTDLTNRLPSVAGLQPLFHSFPPAVVHVAIFKSLSNIGFPRDAVEEQGNADLLVTVESNSLRKVLRYFPFSERVFMECDNRDRPVKDWTAKGTIIGVVDLTNCHVALSFPLPRNSSSNHLAAVSSLNGAEMFLGNYGVTLSDFRPTEKQPPWVIYRQPLPGPDGILNRTLRQPLPIPDPPERPE